jgi:3-methyladenine DNA glycosylase AlkD
MTGAVAERTSDGPRNAVTAHAVAFVAKHKPRAEAIGRDLAELTGDPEAFALALRSGLQEVADPDYLEGQRRVAPGIGALYGVRWPLIEAVKRGFRESTRRERTSTWLFVADRLLREPELESQWFAFGLLERLIQDEPERTWQLVRRAARGAADWITVDSLAHVVGKGILAEPYRWAELEQLVYSPSRWERRLVGSTVATTPFIDRHSGRQPEVADHGLGLIGQLIGDAEPDVQKALAWALRSLVLIDLDAVSAFCESQAERAAETDDGHRAWVIRDVLPKLDVIRADAIRSRLDGIRRRPGAPSTSEASQAAERFGGGLLGMPQPEPPLT